MQEGEHFEEHFEDFGRWVPGVYRKDTGLEEIIAQCGSQPAICIYVMTGCNFSQDTPPPLPLTQNLLAALQSKNDDDEDIEDTRVDCIVNIE